MNTLSSSPPAVPSTYYLTQDSRSVLKRLARSMQPDQNFENGMGISINDIADTYWSRVVATMRTVFPNVKPFSEEEIESGLRSLIEQELEQYPDRKILCLDRFLLRDVSFPISRLEITRMQDKTKKERQGSLPIPEQLEQLRTELGDAEVILVDDGTYSGGTVQFALNTLQEAGIDVKACVMFLGNPAITQINNIPIRFVEPLEDMIDWVDGRDVTLFAGRMQKISRKGNVATARPYTPPFSDGSGASLDNKPNPAGISAELLEAEFAMIERLQSLLNTRVRIRDILRADFPIPVCEDMPRFSLNTGINSINQAARNFMRVRSLAVPKNAIIDMDGTLYTLNGTQNGFAGSTLERLSDAYTLEFIRTQESCNEQNAQILFALAKQDSIGPSNFFANRYGITRSNYFTETWGKLDPASVIAKDPRTEKTMMSLRDKNVECELLTAAPGVWAEKVLNYLGISDCFQKYTTAEMYTTKDEVYRALVASGYDPQSTLAIGDQYDTDILPAAELGMQTFQVARENPFYYLQFINS